MSRGLSMERKQLKGVFKSLLFLGFYAAMITGYAIHSCKQREVSPSELEQKIEKEPISEENISEERKYQK